ncbi:MAG: recombination regulator RecX, partial [Phycisphaerae bacterium]|nr:recombination regulator RecX [Phycisphaerae bacterium]
MTAEQTNAADRITRLRPLARDPDRYSVHVGRRRVATLAADEVQALRLEEGMAWDPSLAQRAQAAEARDQVRTQALRLLNRRALSEGELAERLRKRGHGDPAIEVVVQRLRDKGLLDDRAYGQALVRQIQAGRPAGRRLLQQKLRHRHLSADLIDALLDEADESTDAVADARRLADSYLAGASVQRCPVPVRRRRVLGLLQRRGFDLHATQEALRDHPALAPDDADDNGSPADPEAPGEAMAAARALVDKKLAAGSYRDCDAAARR